METMYTTHPQFLILKCFRINEIGYFELGWGMGLSLSLTLSAFLHDWEDKNLDLLFFFEKIHVVL